MAEVAAVEEVKEVTKVKEPMLRVWDMTRVDEVAIFGKLIEKQPELWDDTAMQNQLATFQQLYLNPNSMVFEIGDRAGMIAVVQVMPGFRGSIMVAAWKPEAMRVPELWKRAIRATMVSRDLLYVDGLIAEDNEVSKNAAETVGFEFRGKLLRSSYYNGEPKYLNWYTLTREAAGLED